MLQTTNQYISLYIIYQVHPGPVIWFKIKSLIFGAAKSLRATSSLNIKHQNGQTKHFSDSPKVAWEIVDPLQTLVGAYTFATAM
jgi:hypothetical protein